MFLVQGVNLSTKLPLRSRGLPVCTGITGCRWKKGMKPLRTWKNPVSMEITVPKLKWSDDIKYHIYLEQALHQFVNYIAKKHKIVLSLIQYSCLGNLSLSGTEDLKEEKIYLSYGIFTKIDVLNQLYLLFPFAAKKLTFLEEKKKKRIMQSLESFAHTPKFFRVCSIEIFQWVFSHKSMNNLLWNVILLLSTYFSSFN